MDNNIEHRVVLALVMFTSFITPFIGAAVNLALPVIGREFDLNAVGLSWVTMAYLISSAVFLVPFGKLADITGRKRIFFIGNVVLALSSLMAAFVDSGVLLIVFRALQGVGSSMMFATSIALITSVYPTNMRGRAIGLNVTAVYVGLSAAPILGGMLIEAWGWRSLFYVPAIMGIPAVAIAISTIKGEWAEARCQRFDMLSSVVFVLSMFALMYGFSQLPKSYAILITFLGIAGMAVFIRWQIRSDVPLFNVNLFVGNRLFALSNLAALINYATTFAITFILSLYLQYIKGLSPRGAGMLLVIQPLAMALVASWSGALSDRYNPGKIASVGMGIIAIGLALLTPIGLQTSTFYIGSVLLLVGIGFGLFSSPNTNAIMGSVDRQHMGLASGTVATMRMVGQMFSMGIASMILHIYMGKNSITPAYFKPFIWVAGTTLAVFAALSLFGIWASLARNKE